MDTGAFRGFEVALQDPGIAVVTFNQPGRLNGMTQALKRDLVETLLAVGEGKAPGFGITDQAKLDRLAAEFGVNGDLPPLSKAKELALAMMEEYGIKKGYLTFTRRLPAARLEKWRNLGIDPRGIDWEVTEMMHRTHMGVDNDAVSLLVQALRCALADGWGGSMIATEISDVLFGTPKPVSSQVNLAVLQGDRVNLVLHGHSPLVSEMAARAAQDPELVARAQALGAKGINLVGLCCTGNEVLMRQGIPMAGNHLVQELALITGAVEAMVVDYQCIMPSLGDLARVLRRRETLLERQVGLRACEVGVQLNGALARGPSLLVPPQVAQHERQQVMGVGVIRVELGGAGQCLQRLLVEAPVIARFADVEVNHAALGVLLQRAGKPLGGLLQRAPALFGQPKLDERRDVVG